ncbi:MAG: hypothetical protein GXP16_15760 [Gammaproteobacteria bacterium]|nr:hypothetical protein [Gammaproteobacteria bacterium]
MTQHELELPGLFDGGRKTAFVGLMAIALGEVLAQVASAAMLKAVLIGVASGPVAALTLVVTGGFAAGPSLGPQCSG